MAAPTDPDARRFYRAAGERLADARFLLDRSDRTTAAVYLAGYAVECALKAMLLAHLAADPRADMLGQFRGAEAHDFGWLRHQYRAAGGPPPPADVAAALVVVGSWGTELRHNPKRIDAGDAADFVAAADRILSWADRRL